LTRVPAEVHILLGAYVLGSLSAQDRRVFSTHLQSCSPCRAELAKLAGLPRLLDLLDPAEVETLARS
jgi:anti-sigma factor RsiW